MAKLFDFQLVFTQIPSLLAYLPITLELAILSTVLGFLLGTLIAIVKIRKVRVLDRIATVFISIVRGTPILVQLYIAYFGIPMFIKFINRQTGNDLNVALVPGIVYAMAALAINQSAFDAEIIRAALLSVNSGQIEAAESLGMTYSQALRRIILPEALTVALPSLGNAFINAIKGTSLAFTCGVVEMTAQGKILSGRNYRYFEVYVSLAIIYWVLTVIIEQLIKLFERKTSIPDQVELYEPSKESVDPAVTAVVTKEGA
ncbi:MAG: amino acid ABC transporter permease [Clostridiales bacterium]|nr:amino acid ABC transporter permease [Clostridiales bacterium]